jgi:hypothetical protein
MLEGRNEKENRLTEVVAALLDSPHCSGLAHRVASGWAEAAAKDERVAAPATFWRLRDLLSAGVESLQCRVNTQTPIVVDGEVRRPDLELVFTRRDEPREILLWVEVKHGSPPTRDQLKAYVDALRERSVEGAVFLLAPRSDIPFRPGQVPTAVPQLAWQQTAAVIASYRGSTDEIGQFLIGEVTAYLREEDLMDDAMTPVLLVALEQRKRVDTAIKRICEIAGDRLSAWTGDARNLRPLGLGFYETIKQAPKGNEPADWGYEVWWDWNLKTNDLEVEDSRGEVPVFTAGVGTLLSKGIAHDPDGARWAAGLADSDGFVRVRDDRTRFIRYIYPEEVLRGRSLEAQGKGLGDWIVETFDALYKAGPPPSGA